MGLYVGMDVHRRRSQVAVLSEKGEVLANRNVRNDVADLLTILGNLPTGTPVAFEATYAWGWVADLLEGMGLVPHLAHPRHCRAIAWAKLKHDRIDACMLAHLLRTNLLPEAWIPPKEVRDLRLSLRHRAYLVSLRGGLLNRIHALLADQGLNSYRSLRSRKSRDTLFSLPLPDLQREVLHHYLVLVDALTTLISQLE